LIDPGKFRDINTLVQEETKGKGQLEVLSVSESAQSDEIL
jgi:ribosome maturation protein SDO1